MKNSDDWGQYRGILRCKKAVFRVGGRGVGLLTYTWIITEMNHPTLYSMRWLWWHDIHPAPDLRGGYSWEFLVGVCCPVPRILTLFQTKNYHFPHPFSDQISKIHTNFQTWSTLALDGGGDSQFPPVLFSCSRFLNSVDPTISEPGTD